MLNRRTLLTTAAFATVPLALPQAALAQGRKDASCSAWCSSRPGLDPTAGAAAAIGEVVHYNMLERLTKINTDGNVTPLLAESWRSRPTCKTYTFKLRKGVKFHDGEPFDAQRSSSRFERAGGEKSTNKDKRTFDNISTQVIDDYTVMRRSTRHRRQLPVPLGENTAVILEPKSADDQRDQAGRHRPVQARQLGQGLARSR